MVPVPLLQPDPAARDLLCCFATALEPMPASAGVGAGLRAPPGWGRDAGWVLLSAFGHVWWEDEEHEAVVRKGRLEGLQRAGWLLSLVATARMQCEARLQRQEKNKPKKNPKMERWGSLAAEVEEIYLPHGFPGSVHTHSITGGAQCIPVPIPVLVCTSMFLVSATPPDCPAPLFKGLSLSWVRACKSASTQINMALLWICGYQH